jgi:tetratricopeptide (TPR) repeat protein
MAKVIQFHLNSTPEKFGPQRALKKNGKTPPKPGQLNLFTSGKVIRLNQLSTFEEALMVDERGDSKAAHSIYLKAIEQEDCIADSYCNLGILESQDGNHPKAISYFTLALKADPRHSEAHYNLANLYAEVGNFPLAKIHYEIAQEIEPSFPNSYFNLGLTLALMKEYNEAIKVLTTYKTLAPDEEHHQTNDLIFKLSGLS